MKTYIYRTLFTGVLVSSYLTHSQIRPNNNRGEYLRFDEIKDLKKRSTGETEFEDFSFNWDNGFHTALNNQILLKLARKKAKRVWFKRQKKRVRENIEKKLGRNFDNYDQAKEALFLFSEKENIYRNSKPPINKYQSLRSDGYAISKGYLKELKLLQLRKIEISAGNIHNPKYGYLKANGMLLKDIKDLNTLNQKWDNIVIPLGSNINNTHYNTSIYQKLNNLGADFNKQIIALKNNYYNRFNRWEQLNLMQLLLNFEEYKRLSSCGVCLLPSSFYKFKELDKATSRVIETYAMNNRDKRTSIFDTTIDYYGGYGRYIQWMQSRRQEAINKLVNEVHTARFAAENLIAELNITDNSQKNWLYSSSNSSEVSNLSDFLQNNRVHGVEVKEFVMEFLNIIEEIPTAKFRRYEELMELMKDNPFVLLEDCIQQNGLDIANYQQLYDHTLPQSCKNRLDNLGNDFQDQPLNTGNAAVANVDYYSVEITTNPDFNLDGIPDSDAEVYNAYKNKFTDLASGNKDDFQFSCDVPNNSSDTGDITWEFSPYFSQDLTTWNSSNPLTTIFKIEAGAYIPGVFDWLTNLSEDDGAIMISAYTTNYWIGSTIATEFSDTQPFSGNRQWGWLINQNNKLELFARAVDIARVSAFTRYNLLAGSPSAKCKEDTYYNIGEATWSNLQNEIKQWINDNGGQAEVIPKIVIRFDKTKLKELLKSNETIGEINCN